MAIRTGMPSLRVPMNSKDLFTYVMQPYLEGAERLNRAWEGVDFHSLTLTSFSLKERVIFLITGICLTFLPLINTIIWLAWQTFGNPEILSDPFIPVVRKASLPTSPPAIVKSIEVVEKPAEPAPKIDPIEAPEEIHDDQPKIETFSYSESTKSFRSESHWKVETLPDSILVNAVSPREQTLTRYNRNWVLQEYHFNEANAEFHVRLLDNRQIEVRARRVKRIEERNYRLEGHLIWIQQPTLGLKNFILDKEQKEIHFYSIRPDNLDIVEVIAKKTGEEMVPGYGKLIRVEMKMDHCIYRYLREGEMWFDPKTGVLRKLIDSGRFMETMTTEFLQNNQPPGPEHP